MLESSVNYASYRKYLRYTWEIQRRESAANFRPPITQHVFASNEVQVTNSTPTDLTRSDVYHSNDQSLLFVSLSDWLTLIRTFLNRSGDGGASAMLDTGQLH
jgi:hypothetical protein